MAKKSLRTRTVKQTVTGASVVKYATIPGWQISIARNGSTFDVCEIFNGQLQHDSNVTFFKGVTKAQVEHAHWLACDYAYSLAKARMGAENVPQRFFRDNVVL